MQRLWRWITFLMVWGTRQTKDWYLKAGKLPFPGIEEGKSAAEREATEYKVKLWILFKQTWGGGKSWIVCPQRNYFRTLKFLSGSKERLLLTIGKKRHNEPVVRRAYWMPICKIKPFEQSEDVGCFKRSCWFKMNNFTLLCFLLLYRSSLLFLLSIFSRNLS